MLRREFCKIFGLSCMALPFAGHSFSRNIRSRQAITESEPWFHGSPYLGHSDRRISLHGLTQGQVWQEIVHFRTAEPWRQRILFKI